MTAMKYTVAILVVFVSLYSYYFWYHQDTDLTLLFYEKFGREPCSVLGGKVVWITGASSGIGEHLAYELARCGCKLALSARRKHELEKVRDNCAEKYPSLNKDEDLLILPLDITKFATHQELTNHAIQHFGKIDVLVNNAGVAQFFSVEDGDFEVEQNLLDTNLLGTISLMKAVLPHMLKRQQGQIVVVSSIQGKYPLCHLAAYTASKFALQTFKDTPYFKPGWENNTKLKFMSTKRHGYLMTVAMANNLKETWPSTQPLLVFTYLAKYMPSFFMWLQENVKVMRYGIE